jgi:hypothetical protein
MTPSTKKPREEELHEILMLKLQEQSDKIDELGRKTDTASQQITDITAKLDPINKLYTEALTFSTWIKRIVIACVFILGALLTLKNLIK